MASATLIAYAQFKAVCRMSKGSHEHAGSAKTTADGDVKTLISNLIPVTQNEQLPVSIWTRPCRGTGSAATRSRHTSPTA